MTLFIAAMMIYMFIVILFSVPVFIVFAIPVIPLGIFVLYSCVVKKDV